MNQYFNNKSFLNFGENLLDILNSPDLTIPALIKEDNNVDFHSVYSQYLYEYLFRMKNIYAGKKPAATFTFLSERELLDFTDAISSSSLNEIAEEVKDNDEGQMLLSLRWYCSSPKFSTYSDCSLGSTWFTTNQLTESIKPTEANSSLLSLMTLLHDTITFHCKLIYETINEIEDELRFLQEYDMRWNAYIASMIKLDEILTPLAIIVNKVYKRVYPELPCYPQFSFLRFFIFIWRKEVYNMCKESIEDYIIKLFTKFHKSCLSYGKQEKSVRKAAKTRTSLSDYFKGSNTKSQEDNGFNSMVNPMLSRFNINQEDTKNSIGDLAMTDQEDEHNFILDIEMMYGKESDSQVLSIERQDKECITQILADVMDLSIHEYSMHYILHSENEYMTPFRDLKNRIKEEIFKFYKSSCESIPFKIWSELINEHCLTLSSFLPV
jgi:hypothetical protein